MRTTTNTSKSWLRRRREGSPLPHVGKSAKPARARTARWRRWLVGIAVALLVVWAAPLLVAHTPLRNHVLGWAAGDLNGTLTADSASLGWFSPVVLRGVEVRDAQGELVLAADELSLDRTSMALLADRGDLGSVRLRGVAATVRMHDGTSNLESLFTNHHDEDEDSSTSAVPNFSELEITEGELTLTDGSRAAGQQMTAIQARLTRDGAAGLRLEATAQFADAVRGGQLELTLATDHSESSSVDGQSPTSQTQLDARGQHVPLAALQPLLRRCQVETQLGGWLSGDLSAAWQSRAGATKNLTFAGEIRGEQLLVASPRLAEPVIRVDALHCPARVEWKDSVLSVEQCAIDCDAGRLELAGDAPLDLNHDSLAEQLLAALADGAYHVEGRLDLPRLAAMLPETIRVRQDTQITDGVIDVRFDRKQTADGASWEGRVYATSVEAICGGRRVAWERPVELDVAVLATPRGPVIDRLVCSSEFLHLDGLSEIEADGSQTALIAADYDLDRLGQHLDRFFDLGTFRLSGRGWTHLQWTQKPNGVFTVEARTQIQDCEVTLPDQRAWREPSIVASGNLIGKAECARPYAFGSVELNVRLGDDTVIVRIPSVLPIPMPRVWPLEVEIRGNVAAWQSRIELLTGIPFVALPKHYIETGVATGQLTWHDDHISVDRGYVKLEGTQYLRHGGLRMRVEADHTTEVRFAGAWDPRSRAALIKSLRAEGTVVNLETENAAIQFDPDGSLRDVSGAFTFGTDLENLQRLLTAISDSSPSIVQAAGAATGTITISPREAPDAVVLDATVTDFALTFDDEKSWREPELRLIARGERAEDARTLIIDEIDVRSPSLRGKARGRIDDLAGAAELRLEGDVDYDINNLLALLLKNADEQMVLNSTRRPRPFRLAMTLGGVSEWGATGGLPASGSVGRQDLETWTAMQTLAGKLPVAPITASSEFDWNGAVAYGFRIGPGRMQAELREGVVRFEPIDVSVNDGKLTAQPWIDLHNEPAAFHVAQGSLLSQVKITPEMANGALKYIAPVLDGATHAEGRFSIDLAGCSVPLSTPGKGEIAGRMTVHAVDIGPGPTLLAVQKVENMLRAASGQPAQKWETARLKRESVVRFRMVDGSVYHDGLELDFDGMTVKTRGRVGLDGTLNLAASFASPRLPGGKQGSPGEITLPITGTLGKPELDLKNLPQALGGSLLAGTLPRLPGLEKFWEKLNGAGGRR